MSRISRPALRWHGGKWRLAPWIISHLPKHRVYVEPFGGAASVLLRKPRAYAEVYNDLDQEVVNLFRVLRDRASADQLRRALEVTPFAREEFNQAYRRAWFPVERARRLIIRSFMGFGSDGATGKYRTGFRANSNRSGSIPAHDWMGYPAALETITDRLAGVVVEQRPARDVMRAHDGREALHYLDPPYLPETRSRSSRRPGPHEVAMYRHEMTRADHAGFLEDIRALTGMVVLSGYPSDLYDAALHDWRRIERAAHADGAKPRKEVLWINPVAAAALVAQAPQPNLFSGAAA